MVEWKPVQLPKNLVDAVEKLTKKKGSYYRNTADLISSLIRKKLEEEITK